MLKETQIIANFLIENVRKWRDKIPNRCDVCHWLAKDSTCYLPTLIRSKALFCIKCPTAQNLEQFKTLVHDQIKNFKISSNK